MKKIVMCLALATTLVFAGCSKDEDDNKCASCEVIGITIDACDNGDGTVTLTTAGQSEILSEEELEGVSASDFVRQLGEGCSESN